MMYLLLKKYDQSVIVKSITHDDGSVSQVVIKEEAINPEYQAYLKWLNEGNKPEAAA